MLDATLSTCLNTLAPLKTKTVTLSTPSPWYTSELCAMKQVGRRLERLCRKTKLTVHAEAYRQHSSTYRDALRTAKSTYLTSLINNQHNTNSRHLFSTVTKLFKPPESTVAASPALGTPYIIHR